LGGESGALLQLLSGGAPDGGDDAKRRVYLWIASLLASALDADLAIDLGTANTPVCARNGGIMLSIGGLQIEDAQSSSGLIAASTCLRQLYPRF
jgi:hypothetical protein